MKLALSLPPGLQTQLTRFDALSLRERIMIAIGVLGGVLMLWQVLLMQPLQTRQANLLALLESSDESSDHSSDESSSDESALVATDDVESETPAEPEPEAIDVVLLQRESLRTQLATLNQQLQATSAQLIAPERTSEVLHEVLQQQRNLTLISLHSLPVRSLVPVLPTDANAAPTTPLNNLGPGPYLHPVELVIDGRYLDILTYLRALEALPWRFHWQKLELDASRYPVNRVRIELGTLSLDAAWMGT